MQVLSVVLLAVPWLVPSAVLLAAQDPGEAPPLEDRQEEEQEPKTWRIGPGPWDDDLVLLRSEEGSSWEQVGILAPHGGVPSACRMADGRLLVAFQWFPFEAPEAFDRVAVVLSADDGETWGEPTPITVEGLPEDLRRPFDPCVVALPDGRLRMYFSSHQGRSVDERGFEAGTWPATWSAISDDGLAWTFEPGRRFGVEGLRVLDPTVVRFRGDWHYFAPLAGRDGAAFHAVSRDGLEFQRWPEVEAEGAGRWLGCALAEAEHGEADAYLRFYGTGRVGWSATSRDTREWRLDGRVVWSQGADPAVVRLQDGARLMIATAPGVARRDADSALLDAMTGGPTVAMTANDRYLYVLRGETIYMYEASTLRFLRLKRLPPLKQPGEDDADDARPPQDEPSADAGDGQDG